MAIQNKSSANTTSSTPSNNGGQSTSINQSLFEPYVVEMNNDYYQDDANDFEMLDPQSDYVYGYRHGTHDFRFEKLGELIKTRTASSAAKVKIVWQQIREEAQADNNIPTALFSPPRTYIQVRVSKWPVSSHYCCACDIAEGDCEVIEIRAPKNSSDGITKDIFIRQVSDAFYGQDPDADEAGGGGSYKIGDEDDRPVIEDLDYMIQSSNDTEPGVTCIMGHIFALTKGIIPKTSV
ncbi:hypothetical protein F4806DRAFT_496438 [Annulohypoxylon nitens]|nr:hypothetical protein F4806DRAFT_496438 [Annulohypoxylon nitens]